MPQNQQPPLFKSNIWPIAGIGFNVTLIVVIHMCLAGWGGMSADAFGLLLCIVFALSFSITVISTIFLSSSGRYLAASVVVLTYAIVLFSVLAASLASGLGQG